MNRPTFEDFKKEAMADPEFKKEYEALAPIWELRKKLIQLRIKEGKTQEQVAKLMGTQKSNISRLESGGKASFPTLATISKYANALGYKVNLEFESLS
ncbi:MAG: helix-turn-helix domain-containing protein [Proteobacteria bacterium]|nr:helix-turn-helix domain-containing protein [Pseudomonadota bacterium]MBU1695423.1 helix-turn-helix domain-containing protein [Pseudomonadota bacterium]